MFGKIKYDGIRLIYMITYVMTIVLVINLIESLIFNTFFQPDKIYSGETWSVVTLMLVLISALLPFLVVRWLRNKTYKLLQEEIDYSKLFFLLGFYLIIMNLGPATRIINEFTTICFYLVGLNSSFTTCNLTLIQVLFSVVKIARFIIELVIAYFFIKKSGMIINKHTLEESS